MGIKTTIKTCKLCEKPRYANTSYCTKHFKEREKAKRLEKEQRKKERKESTKKYQEEITKKLTKKADKLYQEVGRAFYSKCFFCSSEYNCLHHFVRKSQSFNTRYDFNNGIPVCLKCHFQIHNTQNSEIEGALVATKGKEWFNSLMKRKHTVVENKQEFLKRNIEVMNNTLLKAIK